MGVFVLNCRFARIFTRAFAQLAQLNGEFRAQRREQGAERGASIGYDCANTPFIQYDIIVPAFIWPCTSMSYRCRHECIIDLYSYPVSSLVYI